MHTINVIDLFCGCGGMSLGFQNAGFNIVAAFDNWEPAIKVYRQNFNHPIYQYDLSKTDFNYQTFIQVKPDLIIGGPPCQDFSSAGKRNEDLGRGNLTISFAQIVTNILPQIVVMENVSQLINYTKYRIAKEIFKAAGYGMSEKIIDASFCGVPQKRKRFFLIGVYGGKDKEIEPYLESYLAKKPMTVKDYFGDKLEIKHYYRHPRSYKRRAIFSIDEPSATVRGVNRPIPQTYQNHPGDSAKLSSEIRPLTTIERSYLQTFPEGFIWEGCKTNLEQMIGNAVPVKLAEYVANSILEYLKNRRC
ncbi:DNA cytosine methyltransferase [Okeania sp. SIO1I7]|uniref:DNA cytosine methyltransferase n=1 Tax=Okeania sp. SIO1I7 TaxID=2607772 RepID=UPI0013F88730|nr:DNA cytosine methyltransferase [Okeania sp. SIO1I7]NET30142.1 DNA cytosine methyltransferase [Okeania sp. SIO1I7]